MRLRHLVIATDESDAGRAAVRWGLALGAATGARITILRAIVPTRVAVPIGTAPAPSCSVEDRSEQEHLRRWLAPELAGAPANLALSIAVTRGVPGIEIPRFAESHNADVLVLGRKARSQFTRMLVGDTADSVARRSRIPCAFVPVSARAPALVLAAIDGSERAAMVADAAIALGHDTGASVRFVTVEPETVEAVQGSVTPVPLARTERIQRQVADRIRSAGNVGPSAYQPVLVQRGPVVTQILETLATTRADLLLIGYRRGGPAGVIEAGATARQLLHTAPTVVMTIPI